MPANSKQKLKILYIMKILLEKSDENHLITVYDIINELKEYGVSAERKSVYTDIDLLIYFGLDIICEKGRVNKYFVGSREFELPELKLLVDVVQVSKFITHKKSLELIKKLEKFTSCYEELRRQVIVGDRVKIMNESIYYNVDTIHSAIQQKKKVEFRYFDYTVEKEIKFRHEGSIYSVSPYALTWAEDNYYMIAFHDRYDDISHFRVDRMMDINLSEVNRYESSKMSTFNIVEYSNKVFNMFSGNECKIVLKFDNSLVNVVIDRFGKDIFIHSKTDKDFKITVKVAESSTFFGWLLMFGNKVEIVEPMDIRNSFIKFVDDVKKLYD